MPRYSSGLTKVSVDKLAERASHYRVRGLSGFIDRFPLGFGTLPEKIVYDALSRRNIPFYYLNDIELTVPEINFDQFFQADFILPTLRIIIEVQGARWHSMDKTIESLMHSSLRYTNRTAGGRLPGGTLILRPISTKLYL
jgi:hypothetical protein